VQSLSQPRLLAGVPGESRGVLLVHGFSGSPFELYLLAERLHREGFHVSLPLLTGHHSSLHALADSTWHDWLSSAEEALLGLHQAVCAHTDKAPQLAIVGFSMGGLLSIDLARRYPACVEEARKRPSVAALSILATPLWLPSWQQRAIVRLSQLAGLRRLAVPKLAGRDVRAKDLPKEPLRPWGMPVRALASLVELMQTVRPLLPEVKQPTFLSYGLRDHTVPPACLDAFVAELGTPKDQLSQLVLPESFHILPLDVEREQLFLAVSAHLQRHLPKR